MTNTRQPILSPLLDLLHSRKFLLTLADTVISLLLYYHFADKELILILQPLFIVAIGSIAYEDGQAKSKSTMTNVQAETVSNVGTTNTAAPLIESTSLNPLSTAPQSPPGEAEVRG